MFTRLLMMLILLGACSSHHYKIKTPEKIKQEYQKPVMAPPPSYGNKVV